MFKLDININRSGKLSGSMSNDAIQGIIPPDPNAPAASDLLMAPCELVIMDCYGVIWNPEDVILQLQHPAESESVYYAMLVIKASETDSQISYRLAYPLELEAVSEPFGDRRDVTIRAKFPLTRQLATLASAVNVMNVPSVDQQVFRRKTAVFVPDGINTSLNAAVVTWTSSVPVSDTTATVLGTITNTSDSAPTTYTAIRTPLCNIMEGDMSVSRLEPELELSFPAAMRSQRVLTDLGFPVALSQDGAKLYFDCYKSTPRGDDPQYAPTMSFGFCTPKDPFSVLDQLSDVMFLTVGPEDVK